MVSAPVKSAPVNDPKNVGTPGAQVRMMAPKKSGTIIMPPGIRSIVRLMGICTICRPRGALADAPTSARHAAPRRATLQASAGSGRGGREERQMHKSKLSTFVIDCQGGDIDE